jgi:hypothetical protein
MADPLDTSAPWPLDDHSPGFYATLRDWPDRGHARLIRDAVLAVAEQRAAAQAPVVNVTLPGVPGHFTGVAGQGDVAYVPGLA